MQEKTYKAFISYSHKDEKFVDKLMIDLTVANLNATYDRWVLKVGDSLIEKIVTDISSSSYFIVVISHHSINSNWVKKELSIALEKNKIKVIPIKIDNCPTPLILKDRIYIDFQYWYFNGFQKLLESINPNYKHWGEKYNEASSNKFKKIKLLKKFINNYNEEGFIELIKSNELFLLTFLEYFRRSSIGCDVIKINSNNISSLKFDFSAINESSLGYEVTLIKFIDLDIKKKTISELKEMILSIKNIRKRYIEDKALLIKTIFCQSNINIPLTSELPLDKIRNNIFINIKVVFGRRRDYTLKYLMFREGVLHDSDKVVEVVSYDRVLGQIEASIDYFGGQESLLSSKNTQKGFFTIFTKLKKLITF